MQYASSEVKVRYYFRFGRNKELNQKMDLDRDQLLRELTSPGMDYEVRLEDVPGGSFRVFEKAPKQLRDLYDSVRSDETFLVFEDERYTFNQVSVLADKLGNGLLEKFSLKQGDRVAISMRN